MLLAEYPKHNFQYYKILYSTEIGRIIEILECQYFKYVPIYTVNEMINLSVFVNNKILIASTIF